MREPPKKRVFLKDIAKHANLSVAAVSMAMKEHPSLSEETIKRVKSIAEEMGYCPDPVMSALAAHRSRTNMRHSPRVIALITNAPQGDDWLDSHSGRVIYKGIEDRCKKLGYKLQYFWIQEEGASHARFQQILETRGIESIIISPYADADRGLSLDWGKYYISSLNRPVALRGIPYCSHHHFENLQYLIQKLIGIGSKRIGFVSDTSSGIDQISMRDLGIMNAYLMQEPFTDSVPCFELNNEVERQINIKRLKDWTEKYEVDSIVSTHAGAYHLISEFSCLPFLSMDATGSENTVAGVYPDYSLLGETAVDLVHQQFLKNEPGCSSFSIGSYIESSWKDGISFIQENSQTLAMA